VHPEAPRGVWATQRSCYAFIADALPASASTLETGCGLSTVLFAQWSAAHVCVVPCRDEERRTRDWLASQGVDHDHVRFEVGWSDELLPRLQTAPLDLVLIDGGHGFPTPIIDWYYSASGLKAGGHLILDDVNLPHVALGLVDFLDADPRWERVRSTAKWIAYECLVAHHAREDWCSQGFLGTRQVRRWRPAERASRRHT
jgi:predicted O-methyltransferase YrrM